jgi:hypothetical protein
MRNERRTVNSEKRKVKNAPSSNESPLERGAALAAGCVNDGDRFSAPGSLSSEDPIYTF